MTNESPDEMEARIEREHADARVSPPHDPVAEDASVDDQIAGARDLGKRTREEISNLVDDNQTRRELDAVERDPDR